MLIQSWSKYYYVTIIIHYSTRLNTLLVYIPVTLLTTLIKSILLCIKSILLCIKSIFVIHCNTCFAFRQIFYPTGSEDLVKGLYNIVMKRLSKSATAAIAARVLNSYSSSSNVAMIRMMAQDQEMKQSIVDLLKLIKE